jgi:hypothetical protein
LSAHAAARARTLYVTCSNTTAAASVAVSAVTLLPLPLLLSLL